MTILEEEVVLLRANIQSYDPDLRKNQADTKAAIGDLKNHIQQLRGITDSLRKDISSAALRANLKDEEYNDIKQNLDNLVIKVNFIENFLEIGKGRNGAAVKGIPDKERIYTAAHDMYEQGKYEKARAEFQRYLTEFPDTELSDNAQFLIGETYYYEGKYKNALAEYEKVTKNFPEGNKAPDGLLKQGLTLLLLREKVKARTIFQQVINDYPYTNQAKQARSKLIKLK
jgi:tol-pal system protein YbgF